MREISCPLKKSWKLRWRKARRVVAHFGSGAAFASVSSAVADFCCPVTLLQLFHISGMTATGGGMRNTMGAPIHQCQLWGTGSICETVDHKGHEGTRAKNLKL